VKEYNAKRINMALSEIINSAKLIDSHPNVLSLIAVQFVYDNSKINDAEKFKIRLMSALQ